MAFIATWAQNKASEYLKTGIQAGGTLAGNAVGGVGGLIENSGRSFGEGTVNGSVRGVGTYINGYGDNIKGSMAADGPVKTAAKNTAVKPGDKKAAPAQKALPASATKPAGQVAKPNVSKTAAVAKPSPQKPADGKVRIPPASKPKAVGSVASTAKPTRAPAKPVSKAPTAAKPLPGGKTRISAASRPKPAIKA